MEKVDMIFYKSVNPGDLWNIDRPAGSVQGGGGQTYIDLAGIDDDELQKFLEHGNASDKSNESRKIIEIDAFKIGDPTVNASITFDPRPDRPNYRINNQHRFRHPAWDRGNGFPTIPATATGARDVTNIPNLTILIVRTVEKKYYAGYVNSENIPENWPKNLGLEKIFEGDRKGILSIDNTGITNIPENINRLLKLFEKKPNILLYGPPGTGKTHTMQWLWKNLNKKHIKESLLFDNTDANKPFIKEQMEDSLNLFSGKTRIEWLTFHQNLSHEDFVIGLRPKPTPEGLSLEPKLGVLLDVIASIQSGKYENSVIFIDELNRGNVARIFGQLITFLEFDKRGWNSDGSENDMRLPLPLSQLKINGNKTEKVKDMNDNEIELNWPLYFPYPIYILASMNSVDKAIAPLDTALARRFTKVEYGPDYKFLANYLKIDPSSINANDRTTWTAYQTAYLMLKRVNTIISITLGNDFMLGHAYVMHVGKISDENDAFKTLSEAWEGSILPQLIEKFSSRQNLLSEILKVEKAQAGGLEWYPYKFKKIASSITSNNEFVCENESVYSISHDSNKIATLMRFLADE